jgi:hypothetical protein
MAQLISVAGNYPGTEFNTLIPELTDIADVREAFLLYHFGVENFNGSTDIPAVQSIHGHIETFKSLLDSISASAVVTLSGTTNEISVSASTGFVTLGLPNDVTISNDLTITNDIFAGNDLNVSSNTTIEGALSVSGSSTLKNGINVFSNTSNRNSAIPSPAEGTMAYITEDEQHTVYDGSSWVGIEIHGTLGGRIDSAEVLALLGL